MLELIFIFLLFWCVVMHANEFQTKEKQKLRNGPDKNDSNNGNKHVGMQKRC